MSKSKGYEEIELIKSILKPRPRPSWEVESNRYEDEKQEEWCRQARRAFLLEVNEKMKSGKYIGSDPSLQDKTALVMDSHNEGKVMTQADDVSTGLGYGWHEFPATDWRVE